MGLHNRLLSMICLAGLLLGITGFSAGSTSAASFPPLKSSVGMVLSSHPIANNIGMQVLKDGANAVDAAVAVGYALAVVLPAAGNLGGGGFALIHMAKGDTVALDFREVAPANASRDMYLNDKGEVVPNASTEGFLAAGVPGTVAGMSAMLERYGTRSLAQLIAPSIEYAESGYVVGPGQAESFAANAKRFRSYPSASKYFLKPDGTHYREDEIFAQKDLAKTLRLIAANGAAAFYEGPIADMISADMAAKGGLITKSDLAKYAPVWRDPVWGTYRGYEVVSMCPPSSGGIHIVQILNILEGYDLESMGFSSSSAVHVMAEAMRHAYADRSEFLGDPDFVKVPTAGLTSKNYAAEIRSKISLERATPSSEVKPGAPWQHEGTNTTHYSIVDRYGNAVAVTYTINGSYGCGEAIEGAGFLMNNEMDDFSIKPGVPNLYGLVGGDANAIEPYKRPLSSMSPSMVFGDGRLFMVLGSPGGARIITTVLQVILNVIDHTMDIREAVDAPRIHMQWVPDEIRIEKRGLSKDVESKLTAMGHNVVVRAPMGDVNAILVDPATGILYGAGDSRNRDMVPSFSY
mgnify:FL=1